MTLLRNKKIRVLVVDDSPVARELLVHLLHTDPAIQVVGIAADGAEAIEGIKRHQPDVVTMDYHMPKMNGMDATREIMTTHPVPIIIVSGSPAHRENLTAFDVLEAGALALAEKPAGIHHPRHEAATRTLLQTVKSMSEVKVVRRWSKQRNGSIPPPAGTVRLAPASPPARLVAIGVSTGGPLVLKTILSGLPKNFPAPILIVQHIASGFAQGLADWLSLTSGPPVRLASDGELPLAGHAYIAPDGHHMTLARNGRIALLDTPLENGHRPSVSVLFDSVAQNLGGNVIGVLLTGMGKDGARELKQLKDRGAVTIAQDQSSSVVYGMPAEAVAIEAAVHVLNPEQIITALISLMASATKTVPEGVDAGRRT